MSTVPFYVGIVTTGRHVLLLNRIVQLWNEVNVECVVAAPEDVCGSIKAPCIPVDTRRAFGDARQATLDFHPEKFMLVSDDDIIPLTCDWSDPGCVEGAIRSVRLVSVLNQRWFDWSTNNHSPPDLPYSECNPRVYITSGSQLIAPDVRRQITYKGRLFTQPQDVDYCLAASQAGFRLLPPLENGPVLLHMDRKPI